MRTLALLLAVVLSTAAAGAAGLIVLPAPSKALALAAIVASERSAFIVAAAAFALVLALLGLGEGRGGMFALAMLLALSAIAIGSIPLAQARQLARARGVPLDLGRYLFARIDTEGPGHPDRTLTYAKIGGGSPTAARRDDAPPGGPRPLAVDVYLPAERPARPGRPLLVLHGGFWAAGQQGEAALASRRLAELGFTVFDVEYRIAPQPNWQTAVGDVKCAIGWIKSHASTADWNVDPAKVALLGRSAGGHLALMAAYTAAERDLPASCPVADSSVDAVVALYAPTDLAWGYDHPSNAQVADSSARLRAFLGGPPDAKAERYRALSPSLRVTSAAPRTLLVQGGRDQFVSPEHMERLTAQLRAHTVEFDTLFIPYAQHGFDFVPGSFSSQLLEAALLQFLEPQNPQRVPHLPR